MSSGREIAPKLTRETELSVVVPVYGCADCLGALHHRLTRSVSAITNDYELVFVDDRSEDGAWPLLEDMAGADDHVRAFRLSRNFGQDAAITAGLAQAGGRWAVVMDCDLQEAPEDIPRLWAAAANGFDVVRTTRRGWQHSSFRRVTSRIYRRMTLQDPERAAYSNLSLLSRPVIDAFLRLRDRDREYAIALDWLGFATITIEIEHHARHAGRSGYTLRRLMRVATDGLFFRSTALLRSVVALGFVLSLGGAALAVFEVTEYFEGPNRTVPGYTSLAVLLLLLAGFIIVSVGVVGLYVGRVFEQVKDRPLYLIDARTDYAPPLEPVSRPAAPSGQLSERSARTPSRAHPES